MPPAAVSVGLAEAAVRLGISETVLVRLSQFFQVPSSAYATDARWSAESELWFSPGDLAFFKDAHAALLAGHSLEQIRALLPTPGQASDIEVQVAASVAPAVPAAPVVEAQATLADAAEAHWQRYRRKRPVAVFQALIKAVQPKRNKAKKSPNKPSKKPKAYAQPPAAMPAPVPPTFEMQVDPVPLPPHLAQWARAIREQSLHSQ